MDETNTNQGDVKTSQDKEGSTSAPKTYTEEQYKKAISDTLSKAGREKKTVETELETVKSQLSNQQKLIDGFEAEKSKLQAQIDELSQDDPDKKRLIKKLNEVDEKEKTLKADRDVLEAEKATHSENIKLAKDTLREVSIWQIAGEFDGGNPEKLKELVEKLNVSDDEQIRVIATTLWAKKEEKEPFKPFSGVTSGGGEDLSKLSPDEKLRKGFQKLKK